MDLQGTQTILVAEDDDVVRDLTARMLTTYGYQVMSAPDGATALAMMEKNPGAVDLLVTDVVMPVMSGATLGAHAAASNPNLRILYVSGYLEQGSAGLVSPTVAFLKKPFTPTELAAKVRELLDGAVTKPV